MLLVLVWGGLQGESEPRFRRPCPPLAVARLGNCADVLVSEGIVYIGES